MSFRLAPSVRDRVLADLYAETGVQPAEILSPTRAHRVAHVRQLAMWRLREIGRYSLPEIGRAFSRDHATVIHACRQVERRLVHREPSETWGQGDARQACRSVVNPRTGGE